MIRLPFAVVPVLAVLLTACATPKASPDPRPAAAPAQASNAAAAEIATPVMDKPAPAADRSQDTPARSARQKTTLSPGTGRFINRPAAEKPAPVVQTDGEVTLNFEGASIGEVAHFIFDILGENYVLDPQVQGEVTLQTGRPLPKNLLLPTLETLLKMNNAALVRGDGGVYKIVPLSAAVPGNVAPRLESRQVTPGYGVRVMPLRYISAAEMAKILEPLLPQGGVLWTDPVRNLLMLAGSPQELASAQETIDIFDVNWLAGMSIGLYRLQNVDSTAVATEMNNLFGESSQLPLAGLFRFVPVAQLNAVIVITPQAEYLREVTQWIERLDSAGGERLYVYDVQNSSADYLATLLSEVFGGSSGQRQGGSREGRVAPGRRPAQLTSPAPPTTSGTSGGTRAQQAIIADNPAGAAEIDAQQAVIPEGDGALEAQQAITQPPSQSYPRPPGTSPSQSSLQPRRTTTGQQGAAPSGTTFTLGPAGEEVRVVPDVENNSLLIWASSLNYEKILEALRKLDITPRQVLVEATIVEVRLIGNLRYGLRWFFRDGLGDLKGTGSLGVGEQEVGDIFNFGNDVSSSAFVFALSDSNGIVRALLDTLASESTLKVLSTPQVLVVDNREARINVGTEQPIPRNIIDEGVVSTDFQYKETGVILTVTPQIHAGGLITLDIDQQVTDVGPIDQATGQRSFFRRSVVSKVAVQSGQTLVLGGLIQDKVTNSEGGIPVLYKVPIIGPLFGQTSNDSDRTELLIVLTPRIIRDIREARLVSDELKNRMQSVAPLLDAPAKR